MGVTAGGGEALVAKRLLNKVGRGAPGRFPDDPPELAAAKRPVRLLRAKHRIARRPEARTHFLVVERHKHIPRRGG